MSESVRLFEMDIPLNDLVNMLFASSGKSQREGSTLIFIDEIQNSPKTLCSDISTSRDLTCMS